MRITKRTNIAMRVLMYCAANPDRLVTKHEIAGVCAASENHLAQVIHKLALLGVLDTHRGRSGGVRLAHDTKDICVGDVFRAMEGPVPLAECFADVDTTCPLVSACRLKPILGEAAEAFYARLDEVTLDTLMCENAALLNILTPEPCHKGPARR
ncbi:MULTISPECIES: RrF2 family transcriptional regulator [unclassified Shimia]|uniref:RrF2 family transcriptional regulator n=1 Tax=unclassified Shimia TaxID=2630038 RepID=UPI001ADA3439|nr:Rrf2 family transcriptional regulator [Shimia sp. R9_3]MBO9401965.1 Rrf2 family transcriptional regulator [Shimia sp. R9_3]